MASDSELSQTPSTTHGATSRTATLRERLQHRTRQGARVNDTPTKLFAALAPHTPTQWAALIIVVATALLVVTVPLLLSRLVRLSTCEEFTTRRTTLSIPGVTLSVQPSDLLGSFGARLEIVQSNSANLSEALAAIPSIFQQRGTQLVALTTCGTSPRLATLRWTIPPDVVADNVETYGWFAAQGRWQWLSSQLDRERGEILVRLRQVPSLVILAEPKPVAPWIAVEVPEGLPTDQWPQAPAFTAELVVPVGYVGDASRTLRTELAGGLPSPYLKDGRTVTPAVRNWSERGQVNRRLLREVLSMPTMRTRHIIELATLLDVQRYSSIEVDYRGVDETLREPFTRFIEELGQLLDQKGKQLSVVVPAPQRVFGNWEAGGYDLPAIAAAATRVKLDLTANPEAMADAEQLDSLLDWAVSHISRHKLVLLLPASAFQQDARNNTQPTSLEDALSALGPIRVEPSLVQPQSPVRLHWSPEVALDGIRFSPDTQMYWFTHVGKDGEPYTVWLNTTTSLGKVLARVQARLLRGIAVRWLWQQGNDGDVITLLEAYMRGKVDTLALPTPSVKIAFNNSTPFSLNLDSPQLEVQAPGGEGSYTLSVFFQSNQPALIGAVPITVSAQAPTPEPSVQDAADSPPGDPAARLRLAERFELGGHVFNFSLHEARMRGAGMRWVRFYWTEGDDLPLQVIQKARERGFKVLITAVGDQTQVMQPAYRDAWAQRLAELAQAGADAIEVWSEPNYRKNWPIGSINGAEYADLLRRAHQAIKQARPETLVISAALAQTMGEFAGGCSAEGCDEIAFLGQMAAAGAQEHLDCIGAHYTIGNAPPQAVEQGYYMRYLRPLMSALLAAFNNTKPLCFTALGYISPEGYSFPLPPEYVFALNITLAQQTRWLADAVRLLATSGNTRLAIIWNVDATVWTSGAGGDPQAGYAIVRPDGTCPACEAFRNVIGSLP